MHACLYTGDNVYFSCFLLLSSGLLLHLKLIMGLVVNGSGHLTVIF
jgi:hypothetical protein